LHKSSKAGHFLVRFGFHAETLLAEESIAPIIVRACAICFIGWLLSHILT